MRRRRRGPGQVGKTRNRETDESGLTARHVMNKVKILFLAANPGATVQKTRELGVSDAAPIIANPLQLDVEFCEISAAIRASEYRDSFELIPVLAVRPEDFQQALLEHKPHIVHFSGHGSSNAEIIVYGKDGRPQPVSKEALLQLFRKLKDNIRVVFLNACWTRPQVEEIAQTIDFAIGMNQPIGDTAAIVFAASFIRPLGLGGPCRSPSISRRWRCFSKGSKRTKSR